MFVSAHLALAAAVAQQRLGVNRLAELVATLDERRIDTLLPRDLERRQQRPEERPILRRVVTYRYIPLHQERPILRRIRGRAGGRVGEWEASRPRNGRVTAA